MWRAFDGVDEGEDEGDDKGEDGEDGGEVESVGFGCATSFVDGAGSSYEITEYKQFIQHS